MEDTKNTSSEGTKTSTEGAQSERTFTQDDVNRIVQDRLAKERSKGVDELDKRKAELDRREFLMNAKETLTGKGYPAELLEALNCESEETFNKSIELIGRIFNQGETGKAQELEQKKAKFTAPSRAGVYTDSIRKAMGLQ